MRNALTIALGLTLLMSCGRSITSVQVPCAPYAVLQDDTLRMGNGCVERVFLWNEGALATISLTNKITGRSFKADGSRPDFSIGGLAFCGGNLETKDFGTYLLVSVSTSSGSLEAIREYRIYNDVPAISCNTYLRGSLKASLFGGQDNAADRKNIEFITDMAVKAAEEAVLDRLAFPYKHWNCRVVDFSDVTDWNDNLVHTTDFIAYRKLNYRGNLLFAAEGRDGEGFFFLKEAPCSGVQLGGGKSDFTASDGGFQTVGPGVLPSDIDEYHWTRLYGCVTGVYGEGELEALKSLRAYQKKVRRSEDMVMMNTWGDRSQDSKVNESFCLGELELASRLGVSVFQIDDGWQSGKSPNSKLAKGSFKNIWNNPDYWTPDSVKYPRGLTPIVERAHELDMEVGLWFNPSVQNDFADWEKDAATLIGLYGKYGIRVFKIDGLQLPSKRAEENLRALFDRVVEQTDGEVIFNLDATAGRRIGYQYFGEYGNIFLENRYTDWGNYYPYRTLRNLWQLSRYVPAECLQIEFLNPWRNVDKYPEGDLFAPANYSFDYLAAISMAAQPLAWMEASNLPEEAYSTGNPLRSWRSIAAELHSGTILPIGQEPSGTSWTGFQSIIDSNSGYLIIYRENNPSAKGRVRTWLPDGARVRLTPVVGNGSRKCVKVKPGGIVTYNLDKINSYIILKYTLL